MNLIESLVDEFERESGNTRKVLEQLPESAFDWRPHEKSWTFCELASHVAENPSWLQSVLEMDQLDLAGPHPYTPYKAGSKKELLSKFDDNVAQASQQLSETNEDHLSKIWKLKAGDQVMHEGTRLRIIKEMLINHNIHHRGQLTVYLRLKDVPVPGVYGPSADEMEAQAAT